jgi:DNA-binding transcriptional regulator YdaS (Cro superfamily)
VPALAYSVPKQGLKYFWKILPVFILLEMHRRKSVNAARGDSMRKHQTFDRQRANLGRPALERAIARAGSNMELARIIGVSNSSITNWLTNSFVPLDHVPAIVDSAKDWRVTPYTLRPDFAHGWAMLERQLAACHTDAEARKRRRGMDDADDDCDACMDPGHRPLDSEPVSA